MLVTSNPNFYFQEVLYLLVFWTSLESHAGLTNFCNQFG